jgi:hypothetical protein
MILYSILTGKDVLTLRYNVTKLILQYYKKYIKLSNISYYEIIDDNNKRSIFYFL